ncbi:alpha/beta hydrolase [Arthrobacter woluwensis]|uniref:alpha/beta hydrolase n=1 Tax=Arthrobacter woluwensis TaxID=156980 RepID=UPI00119D9277|nr:alpha/beta hydrolase-fold protein [Arthrobacter woluwensis]
MEFFKQLLNADILGDGFLLVWSVLSAAVVLYLLFKEWNVRWFVKALLALVAGAGLGWLVAWWLITVQDAFGDGIILPVWLWSAAVFAGLALAVLNLRRSRWWRKAVAVVGVLLFTATAAFQINAAYGLNPTLGALLNINTANPLEVAGKDHWKSENLQRPLYEEWKAPADLPAVGQIGTTPRYIPAAHSGFPARWSALYLPPAALVKNPPRLPVIIFMLGQPGHPDARLMGYAVNAYAAQHHGLGPIVVGVDQLSDPSLDPLCLDTSMGKVETYMMKDVVPWIRNNLPVRQDRKDWAIVGYSNGGSCAAYFGSKYPQVFGSFAGLGAEAFQGSDHSAEVLRDVFHGDQAAYNAVRPMNIMAKRAPYRDTRAIFTVGQNDGVFLPAAQAYTAAARKAGMDTSLYIVPHGDHSHTGLDGGIEKTLQWLYPRMGLAAPGTVPYVASLTLP